MGKFTHVKKMSKSDQEELFISFAQSIATLRNSVEVANFIKDLLSEPEVGMLARRLQIARLLQAGNTYEQIYKITKASYTTIAKVQTWLQIYGEGYRMVVERTKDKGKPDPEYSNWRSVKKKYPMYFWPQILLGEIVKSANKKEKERLRKVIEKLKDKTKLSKDLEKLLSR